MGGWFWYFLVYSFLGFLLEVAFARVTRCPKRDRKCLYLLPLCPVYGLGGVLILALPAAVRATPLLLFLWGGLAATAAEYAMGAFYGAVAKVRFWDYSHLPLNIGGKVCLLFAALWGVLAVGLNAIVQPHVAAFVAAIPPYLFPPAALLLAGDGYFTLRLLRRTRDIGALRWYLKPAPTPAASRPQGLWADTRP